MDSEVAAPLQCAGATVYAALVSTVKPGDRFGVVGIGERNPGSPCSEHRGKTQCEGGAEIEHGGHAVWGGQAA